MRKRLDGHKMKTHCVHGHPLSGDNVTIHHREDGRVYRNCVTCAKERQERMRLDRLRREDYDAWYRYEVAGYSPNEII